MSSQLVDLVIHHIDPSVVHLPALKPVPGHDAHIRHAAVAELRQHRHPVHTDRRAVIRRVIGQGWLTGHA